MADIFAQISGIPGDSTAQAHNQWIDIISVGEDIHRNMSSSLVGSAQNRTGGAPVVSPIICTKALDSSSPLLAAEAAVGQTGRTITIEWVSAGSNVTYLKWELENCLISSFTTNSAGSDRPTEAFGISWVKLTTTFTKMDQNNQPAGNVVSVIDLSTVTSS